MKKRKSMYIMTLICITCITVVGILGMLPKEEAILPYLNGFKYKEPENSTGVYLFEKSEDDFVIGDKIVDKFIEVYVKGIKKKDQVKNLTPLDKHEIRLILEDMGYNNSTRLRDVLSQEIDIHTKIAVSGILNENLFDYDFERLDRILGIEKGN